VVAELQASSASCHENIKVDVNTDIRRGRRAMQVWRGLRGGDASRPKTDPADRPDRPRGRLIESKMVPTCR
jgi:hypothetical protein